MNDRTCPDARAERAFLVRSLPVNGPRRARRLLKHPRMNRAVPIAPRALLPALVTRALAHGALRFACSLLLSPFSTLASEDATWLPADAEFEPDAPHPTPVMFVHGLFSHPGHFRMLHRFLTTRGFRNFAAFSYAPRVDHEELAEPLGRMIEAVCEVTGAAEVDVVGHSLGGLVARHLLERGAGARVRRLVSLGAPCLTDTLPERESAIFGAADVVVPPPRGLRGRSAIVAGCGHVGLLYQPAALRQVAAFLGEEAPPAARALAAA